MRFLTLVLFFLINSLTVFGQGESTQLRPHSTYQQNGFMVQAILISDSTFFDRWTKLETPKISPIATYKRGKILYPIILFATDKFDKSGNANLTYDFAIKQPDGKIHGEIFRELEAWSGEPAPKMHLVKRRLAIEIKEIDPLGVYQVVIFVHDKVRGETASLSLFFEVIE